MREAGRRLDEGRPVLIERNYIRHAEGSVHIQVGATRVVCTATVEEKVPNWMRGSGKGWITAEYGMLPRATESRNQRESTRGRQGGRTMEIQRLIGRALRSVVDLSLLGERTLWIDCDVLQADGGTRTASITGAFIALADALLHLHRIGNLTTRPLHDFLAATSVGIVDDQAMLDLCYSEDSKARVDMNVVMTGSGKFVEIQGTGEESPFTPEELAALLALAKTGTERLIAQQQVLIGEDIHHVYEART